MLLRNISTGFYWKNLLGFSYEIPVGIQVNLHGEYEHLVIGMLMEVHCIFLLSHDQTGF